jgi:hypothetical protein
MAKRRFRRMVSEIRETTPELMAEIARQGRICAWDECMNVCHGDLPPDWVNWLTWWWPQPDLTKMTDIVMSSFCTRDAVLCGDHARALQSLLKPIGLDPRLDKPEGSA